MDPGKRALLSDLGIDVWVLRTCSEPQPETLPAETVQTETLQKESQKAKPVQEFPAPLSSVGSDQPVPRAEPLNPKPLVTSVELAESEKRFTVVCYKVPGVILLHEVNQQVTGNYRLSTDLLAALVSDWKITVRETEFTWPPYGVQELRSEDGGRAFGAFVEKQMQENATRRAFATEAVVNFLPDKLLDDKLIRIPPLFDLCTDSEQKKQLWRRIQTHQM